MTLLETIQQEIQNIGGNYRTMNLIIAENPFTFGFRNSMLANRYANHWYYTQRNTPRKRSTKCGKKWTNQELIILRNRMYWPSNELNPLLPGRTSMAIRARKFLIRRAERDKARDYVK